MTADQRRDYVAQMYPTTVWKSRVAHMPDGQIFAIYMRDRDKKEAELAAKKPLREPPINTLF